MSQEDREYDEDEDKQKGLTYKEVMYRSNIALGGRSHKEAVDEANKTWREVNEREKGKDQPER
jgi:hypothetical protein